MWLSQSARLNRRGLLRQPVSRGLDVRQAGWSFDSSPSGPGQDSEDATARSGAPGSASVTGDPNPCWAVYHNVDMASAQVAVLDELGSYLESIVLSARRAVHIVHRMQYRVHVTEQAAIGPLLTLIGR